MTSPSGDVKPEQRRHGLPKPPGLHPASPMCPECGREWEYRVRPVPSGSRDYYGCDNGHEWDRTFSWQAQP